MIKKFYVALLTLAFIGCSSSNQGTLPNDNNQKANEAAFQHLITIASKSNIPSEEGEELGFDDARKKYLSASGKSVENDADKKLVVEACFRDDFSEHEKAKCTYDGYLSWLQSMGLHKNPAQISKGHRQNPQKKVDASEHKNNLMIKRANDDNSRQLNTFQACNYQSLFYSLSAIKGFTGVDGGLISEYGYALMLSQSEIAKVENYFSENKDEAMIYRDDDFVSSFTQICIMNPKKYIMTYDRLKKSGML